jgi:hypothetical protein
LSAIRLLSRSGESSGDAPPTLLRLADSQLGWTALPLPPVVCSHTGLFAIVRAIAYRVNPLRHVAGQPLVRALKLE